MQSHQRVRRWGRAPGLQGTLPALLCSPCHERCMFLGRDTALELLAQGLGRWHCNVEKMEKGVHVKS